MATIMGVVRVLLLTKGLGPGGAERLLVEQAGAGTSDVEYQAAYLLPGKQHLVRDLENLGVRTHCLGVQTEADLRWLLRLARLLHRERFDVVHAHSPLSASLARVLVRAGFRATAFVYTEHNRWQSHRWLTRTLNRATFALNDAAIAVSADVMESMTPRARDRTELVIHGIDLAATRAHGAEREAVRSELGVGPHDVLAVTVANLRANKRYPDLLAAARIVLDAHAPVRFVAAGQGPLEAEIRAEHRRLGLGDGFRLLGYRADAPRLIAGADLFVLASSHEGLPVSVMEALALGVPVIATAAGGVTEAVTDGVDGLLVPPRDPGALAGAIMRATEPELRAALAAGAAASGEWYSVQAPVRRIEATYTVAKQARTGERRL